MVFLDSLESNLDNAATKPKALTQALQQIEDINKAANIKREAEKTKSHSTA